MPFVIIFLLALFCIAAFAVVWVVLDNKSLKDKVGSSRSIADTIKKAKKISEERIIKAYDTKQRGLETLNSKLKSEKIRMEKKIFRLEEEAREKDELIESMRSVSICERAFLLDLDE